MEAARDVVDCWSASHPVVADWIEESIEDTLASFALPEPHRRRIRTTNALERFNQEIKRRTDVARVFLNPDACLCLATGLTAEQSEEWLSAAVSST